jgi:hypothetical protein
MKKTTLFAAASLLVVLAIAASEIRARQRAAAAMADAAQRFLSTLSPEQHARTVFAFEDEQRFDWHFVPQDRKGLPLREMNDAQKKAAMEFLQSGLSVRGYTKANTIINTLEIVLQAVEGPNRKWPRDPGLYYVSVFGTPSTKQTWGWRFEGHHLSMNFTVKGSTVIATSPSFFGTNPAEVRADLPQRGLRVLAGEEDLGRGLVLALEEKQRTKAIYSAKAPDDMLSFDKQRISPLDKVGISVAEMNKAQREMLDKLVDEYCNNVSEDLAAARRAKYRSAKPDEIYFAWAGGIGKDDPQYYRVQTPSFLIEYDDTQNNANHIHSVWRDFNGDFGRDLLAEHYRTTPHGKLAAK